MNNRLLFFIVFILFVFMFRFGHQIVTVSARLVVAVGRGSRLVGRRPFQIGGVVN